MRLQRVVSFEVNLDAGKVRLNMDRSVLTRLNGGQRQALDRLVDVLIEGLVDESIVLRLPVNDRDAGEKEARND